MSFIFFLILFFCNPLYGIGFDEFDNFKSDLPLCSESVTLKNYYHKCYGKKANKEISPNGTNGYYIGEWLFDRPHGVGKMIELNDKEKISVGTFRNGYPHGEVETRYKNAENEDCVILGTTIFGQYHGKTQMKCGNDYIYEGGFFYGHFSGYAKLKTKDLKIEGQYFGGEITGTFEINSDKFCDQYGQFYKGEENGQNILTDCPKENATSSEKIEGLFYAGQIISGETYWHDGSLRNKGIFLGGVMFNGYVYNKGKTFKYFNGVANEVNK